MIPARVRPCSRGRRPGFADFVELHRDRIPPAGSRLTPPRRERTLPAMVYPALTELESLFPELYGSDPTTKVRATRRRDELFADLRRFIATSKAAPETPMKFGTSG